MIIDINNYIKILAVSITFISACGIVGGANTIQLPNYKIGDNINPPSKIKTGKTTIEATRRDGKPRDFVKDGMTQHQYYNDKIMAYLTFEESRGSFTIRGYDYAILDLNTTTNKIYDDLFLGMKYKEAVHYLDKIAENKYIYDINSEVAESKYHTTLSSSSEWLVNEKIIIISGLNDTLNILSVKDAGYYCNLFSDVFHVCPQDQL